MIATKKVKEIKEKKPVVRKKVSRTHNLEAPLVQSAIREQSGFIRSVGRRKTAAARVHMHEGGSGIITVNAKPFTLYFPTEILRGVVQAPLQATGTEKTFDITVKVAGGGIEGQAIAVRHGLSRGLVVFNQDFRKPLKALGFLKRDPRKKERKKFGLKKARRAPQWAKR